MIARGTIAVLDEKTIGQIAAGEVVERPLSVVKELVENALDAGATRIAVSLARGGLETIEVVDNGSGIPRDELRLAVARHATSKLRDAGGLDRIATLGFRGEGLAAIASVARVRITSRPASEEIAHSIEAFESAASEPEPVAGPVGTRIAASDLFANVPARREYLKSASAEFARVSAFLSTLSLAYPHVAFVLRHDGREIFTFEAGALERRLTHVFGDGAKALIAVPGYETPFASVRGYVNAPGSERGDRRMQLAFVNDRLLRTTQFAGAWTAAYATFAMQQRHAFGVLFVQVPPAEVDPNVHPTKFDVRFKRAQQVHDTVRRGVTRALETHERERFSRSVSLAPAPPAFASGGGAPIEAEFEFAAGSRGGEASHALRVVAQVDRTYIVATDGGALILVDQHAAHERIAYEEIARRSCERAAGEPLLVPDVVEFDAETAARFELARESLAQAGLQAEPFGERTFRILATPTGYGARRFNLRALLEDLGDEIPGLDARERVWASLACHSVARAGEALESEEMATLLARLERCANPMHCPHGRPTIVRLEPEALARLFKRA
jgi:DNA mismatch repair protein MutL